MYCPYVTEHTETAVCFFWLWWTHCMQPSLSWEANRFSASQEIPRILCNPKVHYHIHKCPPPVPIRSQLDPVHVTLSHILTINVYIILPFAPDSSKCSLSLRITHQNTYIHLVSHSFCIPRTSHSRFDQPIIYFWAVRSLHSSLCIFLFYPVTTFPLKINIPLATLFSNTLSLSLLPQCPRPSFKPIIHAKV